MKAVVLLALAAVLAAADSLPLNGRLDQADPQDARRPLDWDLPDGLGVAWLDAPGEGHGKAIRMDTRLSEQDMVASWKRMGLDQWDIPHPAKSPVGQSYGLSFYSAPFACEAGRPYRVRWAFVGDPGGVKVWVRGYAVDDAGAERRIYEAVSEGGARLAGASDAWRMVEHCFHPTAHTPRVTRLRVMLFAFHPERTYWFDDLQVEPISDADYAAYRAAAGK